jgi:hypothetical protein
MRRHRIGIENAIAGGPAIFAIRPLDVPGGANALSQAVLESPTICFSRN